MPTKIVTHAYYLADTITDTVLDIAKLISKSVENSRASKYSHQYFFIGEDHSVEADVLRRDALHGRIAHLPLTLVIERGLGLSGQVQEADRDSSWNSGARNTGLAIQTIASNDKSKNTVTVFFCGAAHDDLVKEQISLLSSSGKEAAWISVEPTPIVPHSVQRRIKDMVEGNKSTGYVIANTPDEKIKFFEMSQGKHQDVSTLKLYDKKNVKLCGSSKSVYYQVFLNHNSLRGAALNAVAAAGGTAQVTLTTTTGIADYVIREVKYEDLPS